MHYVWDIFGHVIAEHRPASATFKEYAWLGDMPLATVDATTSPSKLYYVQSTISTGRL